MTRRSAAALLVACSWVGILTGAVTAAQAGPPRGYRQVESSRFALPHLSGVRQQVHCPPNTVPLGGGGVIAPGDLHAAIEGSFPTADGWDIDVSNESLSDAMFDMRVTCARTPNRYVVVASQPVTVPAGGQASAFAVCPSPTRTLGGGGVWEFGQMGLNLNSSYPGPFTWNVSGNNHTTVPQRLTAFVVCGKLKGLQLVQGFTTNIGPNAATPLAISCFAPRVPLSGGVFVNSTSTDVNLKATTFSDDNWFTWVNNGTAGNVPAQPYVICAGT